METKLMSHNLGVSKTLSMTNYTLMVKPYKNTHHFRESFFIVRWCFGPIVWMLIFRILFAYFSSCKTHHHSQNYVKLLLKWSVTTELALMKHQMGRMQIISFSSVFLSRFKKDTSEKRFKYRKLKVKYSCKAKIWTEKLEQLFEFFYF